MSRTVDSAQQTGLVQKVVPTLFFGRLMFPTTPIFVHTGIGPITFGGNTYIGIGDYAIFDQIEESLENRPPDITLGIQRVPSTAIDPVINENYHGKDVFLYYSVADAAGQPVSTPLEIWRGTMDVISLEVSEEGLKYIVACKNIMANWNRAKVRRITDAEQQRRFPGDTAFKHLAELEDKTVTWGPDPNATNKTSRPTPHPGNPGGDKTYER